MVNEKFRKALQNYFEEIEEDLPILFDGHAYDNSIVGITEDGRAVYDYHKMVEEFMKDEDCDETDAMEWVDYNTMRSLGYACNGRVDKQPIVITVSVDDIMERG